MSGRFCLLLLIPVLVFAGCTQGEDRAAAVMPNERVAFPVSSVRLGDVAYVTAEALRLDKKTHKLWIYAEAPTFSHPANAANIAIRRNDIGFDVDLSANTDMFIPVDKPENTEQFPATTVNAPAPATQTTVPTHETTKEEKK